MKKNKKIKVLMLLPNLRISNGVTSYAMNYFQVLDPSKFQIDFAIYDGCEMELLEQKIKEQKGRVFVLPGVLQFKKHLSVCRRILQENSYDIIHDNSLINTIPMMWCARNIVPRRILHSHNSKMGETKIKEIRNNIFLPFLKAFATDYAACSQKAGRAMFHKASFTVIPNIILSEKFLFSQEKRKKVREKMQVESKFVIGTVGRIAIQKNPFWAVDVVAEVLKKCPDVEYWWIGDGPGEEELKEQISKKGLQNKIKLLGSRNDVEELYQAMDCFFLPSIFEGLPVTGIEAQAYGLPCILSNSITREVEYTGLIRYVSLQEPVNVWVDRIVEEIQNKQTRRDYREELLKSCFSDRKGKQDLEAFYMQEEK